MSSACVIKHRSPAWYLLMLCLLREVSGNQGETWPCPVRALETLLCVLRVQQAVSLGNWVFGVPWELVFHLPFKLHCVTSPAVLFIANVYAFSSLGKKNEVFAC